MNNPDYFQKLDLIECKKIAHRWGKEYPFIKKVLLYAGHGSSDYVLIAEVEPNRAVNYTRFSKDWISCSKFGGFSNPIFWANRNSTLGYKEQKKSRPEPVIEFNETTVRWEFKTLLSRFSERWFCVIKEPGISEARASLIDSHMLGEFSWVLYDCTGKDTPQIDDHEAFVRNLRISRESNSEIKIQQPGKPPTICHCTALGFRDENTKSWKALLRILESSDHIYNVGPAHDSSNQRLKSYDAKQKRLREISKKLVNLVNEKYSLEIPENLSLFERCPQEKEGTYGPKFKTGIIDSHDSSLEAKYSALAKDKLLNEIERLQVEYYNRPDPMAKDQLFTATTIALQKQYITKVRATTILAEFQSHEGKDIRYDPHENQKPRRGDC